MTLKVKITHDQEAYPVGIKVSHTNAAGEPSNSYADRELKAGETGEFWVHSNQKLVIEELPA